MINFHSLRPSVPSSCDGVDQTVTVVEKLGAPPSSFLRRLGFRIADQIVSPSPNFSFSQFRRVTNSTNQIWRAAAPMAWATIGVTGAGVGGCASTGGLAVINRWGLVGNDGSDG
ncbi:unnamed protein product [Cuscuta epithymum]|uniref:Uncharacterized protein n=1 Tax=Cuscuta epithymum TaxID=186058 RepID=A0AAV0G1J7_9ASTE|nr:unnamed protein product [Cuscuta epithymum]